MTLGGACPTVTTLAFDAGTMMCTETTNVLDMDMGAVLMMGEPSVTSNDACCQAGAEAMPADAALYAACPTITKVLDPDAGESCKL